MLQTVVLLQSLLLADGGSEVQIFKLIFLLSRRTHLDDALLLLG